MRFPFGGRERVFAGVEKSAGRGIMGFGNGVLDLPKAEELACCHRGSL